ncbi:MAG: helix-turn-helix transcriptional regulator [Phycisphaerales bacterium]|jgi:AraC-like DNA-binding protein|nr:helix-turn-helix transcriptional regulator [Phycisphaerales bacterium]
MSPSPGSHASPITVHDRIHVRLLSMGSVLLPPHSWIYNNVRGSYWRLYVNAGPGAVVWSAGIEYPIPPHHAFVIPAWVKYDSRNEREVHHLCFHFDIVGLTGPLVRQWFDRPVSLSDDPLTRRHVRHVRGLLNAGRSDDIVTAFAAKSLVDLSVARLFQILEEEQPKGGAFDVRLLRRQLTDLTPVLPALRRIDDNFAKPALNTELADLCGMSEDHFIRLFRKHVGQTPARYALERRITYAAERLAFGDDSLKQVSAQAGFKNRYHFTRAFARIIGEPPAHYRQRGH